MTEPELLRRFDQALTDIAQLARRSDWRTTLEAGFFRSGSADLGKRIAAGA